MNKPSIDLFNSHMLDGKVSNIIESVRMIETDTYENILEKSGGKNLDPLEKKRITKKVLIPKEDAQVEWWYFTGHLKGKEKEYGFEWCMFKFHPRALRFGFIPLSFIRKDPFLVLHTAITDKAEDKFHFEQDSGIIHPNHVNYKKLQLDLNGTTLKYDGDFKIKSKQMDINISPVKKLIKHFDDGFHMMHEKTKSSTYYVTYPRSDVKGKIRIDDETIKVTGECWFDHQKCVVPQRASLLGWDWFSVMFDDNTELMLITLRNKRGLEKRSKIGTFVKNDGSIVNILSENFEIKHTETWKSDVTDVVYPSKWHVKVPKLKLDFTVTPDVKEQEINSRLSTPICYWEGACTVEGSKGKKEINGNSYVELVGYDRRLLTEMIRGHSA